MQYVYLEIISVLIPPFLVSVQSKQKKEETDKYALDKSQTAYIIVS